MHAIYTVKVAFFEKGYWSKAYTYLSTAPLAVGDAVVVPTGEWYGVGKVKALVDEPEASLEGVQLKYILAKLEF